MTQQSFGRTPGPDTNAASNPAGSGAASPEGTAAAGKGSASAGFAAGGSASKGVLQAVAGPFTVRDLAVFAATLILFIAALLPLFGGRYNLWNLNNQFFLGLGIVLPLAVSALFAARRLSPQTRIRIGSLSIDQFASVCASFALSFFFLATAAAFGPGLLLGLFGAVILFAATVLGRFLPYISADFQGRAEAPAHIVAREAAVPVRKPRAPKEPGASTPGSGIRSGRSPLGARLLAGRKAGSSAVGHGPAAESHAPSGPAGVAAAATAPAGPVSTAPEVSDWAAQGAELPATQATAVVRPASAPAEEQTQHAPVAAPAPAAAPAPEAAHLPQAAPLPETAHDGGAQQGATGAARTGEPPAATAVHPQVRADEPIGATVDPASRPDDSAEQPAVEAFWFAVAQPRTAFDPETGAPAFVIEPGGWVLALEDRGHEFLVQHTDGRIGVLRDLSNIERG